MVRVILDGGGTYETAGDFELALAEYDRALDFAREKKAEETFSEIAFLRSGALANLGKFRSAITELEKTLEDRDNPSDTMAQLQLLSECYSMIDADKKAEVYRDIHPYMLEEAHYLVLPGPADYTLWQPWIKNYHGERYVGTWAKLFNFPGWIWLDQDLMEEVTRGR